VLSIIFGGIVVRIIYALVTAFLICMALTPNAIERLRRRKLGQTIREEGVQAHLEKGGTPSMGGIVILVSIAVSTVVWAPLNSLVIVVLLALVILGAVGFADDFVKMTRRNTAGISGRSKMLGQSIFGAGLGYYLLQSEWMEPTLFVPLVNEQVELGWFYIPFVMLVVVGASNAVNLTDGLDGLAAGVSLIVFFSYAGICYTAGNFIFSDHLAIPFIRGAGELAVFCAAVIGACIGFLWYNTNPASVFMGDTGSLALGGVIGTVAVLVKQEILLVVVGGIFVLEALSVIIQVISFRSTGRRIFRMAPIHHHFELAGWAEPKVVIRFWIITLILALIGMSILGLNSILAR